MNGKKILIVLDYDPSALKVAELGFSLAKSMQAEITLLHVMSEPIYYYSGEYSPIDEFPVFMNMKPFHKDGDNSIKKESQLFLDKVKTFIGDEKIQTLVLEGDIAEIILDSAKRLYIDIIVMGSHSRRWLEKIVMGSVTENVIKFTSIPLFIIPTKKQS